MKKLWILPLAAIMMVACGPSEAEAEAAVEEMMGGFTEMLDEAAEEATEAVEEAAEEAVEEVENVSSDNSECDEFLEGYEDFMDEYITILKKQKADPTDMSIMTEAATIAGKASEWATIYAAWYSLLKRILGCHFH